MNNIKCNEINCSYNFRIIIFYNYYNRKNKVFGGHRNKSISSRNMSGVWVWVVGKRQQRMFALAGI